MMKDPIFRQAFLLIVLIGFLHALGAFLYLYWSVWWYDLVMHTLGGFWVGLLSLWLFRAGRLTFLGRLHKPIWAALFGIALIGVLWEIFEYTAGLTLVAQGYVADTASDLLMDFIGALSAWIYVTRISSDAKSYGYHGKA